MKLYVFMLVLACFSAPLYGNLPVTPRHLRLANAMGLRGEAVAALSEMEGTIRIWLNLVANQDSYKEFRGSLDGIFAAAGENGRNLQHELGRALKGEQGGMQAAVDALLDLDEGELTLLLRKAVEDLKPRALNQALYEARQFISVDEEARQIDAVLAELDVDKVAAAIESRLEELWEHELRLSLRQLTSAYGKMREVKKLTEDDKLAADFSLLTEEIESFAEDSRPLSAPLNKRLVRAKLWVLMQVARRDHPKLWAVFNWMRDLKSQY